jgi:DNA-binding GntR family transcriptional regulator
MVIGHICGSRERICEAECQATNCSAAAMRARCRSRLVAASQSPKGATGRPGRQIYRQIRACIVDGRLAPGERLPSTRTLASELGISRKTTLDVFERLTGEGYLRSRTGDGTHRSALEAIFAVIVILDHESAPLVCPFEQGKAALEPHRHA